MKFFKGSPEADKMLAAKVAIRSAGLRAEKKFFGKRGIFAKAGHTEHLKNPKSYHNIEPSGFHRGEYVGYGDGVWRIVKYGSGWNAGRKTPQAYFTARTLGEVSKRLDELAAKKNPEGYSGVLKLPTYIDRAVAAVLHDGPTILDWEWDRRMTPEDKKHFHNFLVSVQHPLVYKGMTPEQRFKVFVRDYVMPRIKVEPKENPITVVGNPVEFKLLSHGIYAVSDKMAGELARQSNHGKLPREGREIRVTLPSGKEAWLSRTVLTMLDSVKNKRGWVWSVKNFSEAGGSPIPFGKSYGPNPPAKISTTVAGVLYNRCVEIRAEKTEPGKLQGLYYHPFSRKSQVCVLALDNGDLLIHSRAGKKLWKVD